MRKPTWETLELAFGLQDDINMNEIHTYLAANEYSYRRMKQCIHLQRFYPDMWKQTINHRFLEEGERKSLVPDKLIEYIERGYNPDHLIHSLLSNDAILKDYGKCNELGGSLWAFLGSALYEAATTPSK
jgi:hypothetical protein